ncbi:MAG: GNAT family N-acetyltransferase [Proteobacteria bacterium]|nr:GNAT family N-acetyltransferase [Pseudomonadota bacterium]
MDTLPGRLFADPAWHALTTQHSHLAVIEGDARRYPVNVAPFAALAKPTELALWELHSLLAPGEYVWLFGTHYPELPELRNEGTLECVQMVLPRQFSAKPANMQRLSGADSDAMVALTDIAFPGFFRSHTYEMGTYYGVWLDSRDESGQLVAMAGERLTLDGYTEISGVCTHPEHRGKGLATSLIARVARDHAEQGIVSFLHVTATNTGAIELYLRLGFIETGRVVLTRIARPG